MKILIVSDLHGNAEAVSVLPRDYDQLWVLGDLVNYGPNPHEVIEFVQRHANYVVRGNHDHAIGFDTDPRCPEPFKTMAAEMGSITQRILSEGDKSYLRMLPLSISTEVHGIHFHLCHAAPTDPLFGYRPPESSDWETEVHAVPPGCLLVGHTHLQFRRDMFGRVIVNPGSLGQPKTAAPQGCFATWEDGSIQFHSVPYPYRATIEKIRQLQIPKKTKDYLITTLETGVPSKL